MSDNDALADLGLDLGLDIAAGAADTPAAHTEKKTRAPRETVEIGELEFGSADFVPALKRGGGGGATGSKYQFDKLVAPVAKEDGTGWKYSTFVARAQPEVDVDKLKRSVQSAVTAENRKNKEANSPVRFVTRSLQEAGEITGVIVYRVDQTLASEE
jgi:hypothetical protein